MESFTLFIINYGVLNKTHDLLIYMVSRILSRTLFYSVTIYNRNDTKMFGDPFTYESTCQRPLHIITQKNSSEVYFREILHVIKPVVKVGTLTYDVLINTR